MVNVIYFYNNSLFSVFEAIKDTLMHLCQRKLINIPLYLHYYVFHFLYIYVHSCANIIFHFLFYSTIYRCNKEYHEQILTETFVFLYNTVENTIVLLVNETLLRKSIACYVMCRLRIKTNFLTVTHFE